MITISSISQNGQQISASNFFSRKPIQSVLKGSSQHKDLLWKEMCTQRCFPFPLWTVPSLSQLESGHSGLKRPTDTCDKSILPLPDGNNWSLEKVLSVMWMGQSESHLQRSSSSCTTDTFPAMSLPIMALLLWNRRISIASTEYWERQWNLIPT